jgi:hypothetical protein
MQSTTRALRLASASTSPYAPPVSRGFTLPRRTAVGAGSGHDFGSVSVSAPASTAPSPAGAPIQRMFSRFATGSGGKGKQFAKSFSTVAGGGTTPGIKEMVERMMRLHEEAEARKQKMRQLQMSGVKLTPAFRYMDADKKIDYMSPIEKNKGPKAFKKRLASVKKSRGVKKKYAEGHAWGDQGIYPESPFVSMATNPSKAALSTDPWLANIAAKSKNLSVFQVPKKKVVPPPIPLSKEETEHLYMGKSLGNYLQEPGPNPFAEGIMRLSRWTPTQIGALGGGKTGIKYGRPQHKALHDRLRRKVKEKEKNGK